MSKRIPIFLGLMLVIFSVWLQISSLSFAEHWLEQFENAAYDFQLRTKLLTHHPHTFTTSVAIIDIDDKSLKEEGRWPWSRAKLGELLSRLSEEGAVVAAFDMIFPEKEENIAAIVLDQLDKENLLTPQEVIPFKEKMLPFFDADKKLASSLTQIDAILGATFLPVAEIQGMISGPILVLATPNEKKLALISLKGFLGNIPLLQQAAKGTGFINVFADNDGIIRRVPLLLRYKDNLYPSLALKAASLFLLSDIKLVTAAYGNSQRLEGVKIGDYTIPTDARGQVMVPFRGKSYTFPYFSASDVLNKKISPGTFAGKIVFIGTTAVGLGDLKPTAVQNIFPGVEVQATITDGILKNNFPRKPDWSLGAELFLTIFLGLLFTLGFPFLGPRMLVACAITIPFLLIFLNGVLWDKTGYILSILMPILLATSIALTNLIYGYFFEVRRRKRLREMFGQYVPEKHIDEMLKSKGSYALYGEDRDMTVLFADIRGFTTISEKLTASQLKTLLNDIFTPMTEIIFKNRGTIDKYVGDLIMAFWGAPLKDKHHAKKAIAAAIDMQKKLSELAPVLIIEGGQPINMGIGLNSGMMSVGDMGSKFRRNYTVLGDSVNLGSRVESLTSHYGVKIMVTENTKKKQTLFLFRALDKVRVKGKKVGIAIYEVLGKLADVTDELKKEVELSETALNYYYQQQWLAAKELFQQLKSAHPETKLYQLYLDRIETFENNPPPADWDGVYTHTTK